MIVAESSLWDRLIVSTVRCIKKDTSQSSCLRDLKSTFLGSSWEHLKEPKNKDIATKLKEFDQFV